MNVFNEFFGWPLGSVWSNIIASVIWSIPAVIFTFWRIRKHQKRNHKEVMASIEELKK
jgi:preprotein translocase subunit YajC